MCSLGWCKDREDWTSFAMHWTLLCMETKLENQQIFRQFSKE
jgi:hypothetical protein